MNALPKSRLIVFILGLAVGGAGASAVILYSPSTNLSGNAVPAAAATATSTMDASGDVVVQNQPAGMNVTIESVTVPPPGVWAAIQEVNADGSLDNVLGAARVGGPRSTVNVPLLRNTISGNQYAVVLYRNDGDGVFELGKDSVYVDFSTDQPVEAPFTAQ